jgi:hypothetical protein
MVRATCEGCMSIDVRRWHREGRLRAGQHFGHPLTWMGEPTGIGVLVKADAVVLVFRSWTWEGGYGQFIHQPVPVTWTPCAFGGRRPWFRCEVYSGGRYCGRRVALLHGAGGPFACRHSLAWPMLANRNQCANEGLGDTEQADGRSLRAPSDRCRGRRRHRLRTR